MALLWLSGCSPASLLNSLAPRGGLDITTSIAYGEGPRRRLDVYRPSNAARAPVIVFFYGGSWQGGSKDTYAFAATALAQLGYVVVVPDYRVYPEVRFPGFLEDGARAVKWAKANASRFGGDPGQLFVMGHSAGGHIAAMLAIDPRWLAGVGLSAHRDIAGLVGISGPYAFLPIKDETLKVIFGGANRPETQPISYVSGGEPPALLLTAKSDNTVEPGNATRLATRLQAAGSKVAVITYPGVGHVTILGAFAPQLRSLAPIVRDIDTFITRTVSARRGQPERAARGR